MTEYVKQPVESLIGSFAEQSIRRSLGLSATIYGAGALTAWATGSGVLGKPKSDYMSLIWPAGMTLATWANAIGVKLADGLTVQEAFANLNYREAWLLTLITIYGGRLTSHLALRMRDHEDPRYAELRQKFERKGYSYKWLSSICVFLPQAVLQLAVSFPWVTAFTKVPAGTLISYNWNYVDSLGVGLVAAGLYFEAGADYQLERFKELRSANKTGALIKKDELYGLSRHPNYFGDMLIHAGLFSLASSMTVFSKWLAVGPLVNLLTLTVLGGVGTEKSQERRYISAAASGDAEASRKLSELQAYQRDTPALIPRLCLGSKWLWAAIGAGAGGAATEYIVRMVFNPRQF